MPEASDGTALQEKPPLSKQDQFIKGLAFLEDIFEDQALLEIPQNSQRLKTIGVSLLELFSQQDINLMKDFLPIDEKAARILYKTLNTQKDRLAQSPPDQLNTLGLYAFSYLSMDQIGKMYGVSKQAVELRIHRQIGKVRFGKKNNFVRRSKFLKSLLRPSSSRSPQIQ